MKDDGLDGLRVNELQQRIAELQLELRNTCKELAEQKKALKHLQHSWARRYGLLQVKCDALQEMVLQTKYKMLLKEFNHE